MGSERIEFSTCWSTDPAFQHPDHLTFFAWVACRYCSLPTTLEAVWADLAADQKASVRDQLDAIFRGLRAMQLPHGMPFGGVAGEGCKDQRRHLRRSIVPIFSVEDFETFQFSYPKYGSTMFIDFLRAFTPRLSDKLSQPSPLGVAPTDLPIRGSEEAIFNVAPQTN